MEMNKTEMKKLREELQAKLDKFAKKKGLTIKMGNIRFDNDGFRTTLTSTVDGGETPEQKRYIRERAYNPLLPELGARIAEDRTGKEFTIIGWKPRARTRPILIEDDQGMKYVVPVAMLLTFEVL